MQNFSEQLNCGQNTIMNMPLYLLSTMWRQRRNYTTPRNAIFYFMRNIECVKLRKALIPVWKLTKQLKLTTLVLPNLRDLPQHLEEQVGHLLPHMKHQGIMFVA